MNLSHLMNDKKIKLPIYVVILVLVLVFLIFSSFGTVNAGERGVLVQFGAVTGKVFDEGLYFKIPIVQNIVKIDVKVQKSEVGADASSKDLQVVNSRVALNFKINPDKAADLYQVVGRNYEDRLIDPSLQESVKAATAKFTAEELITKRSEVREEIKRNLKEKMEPHGILVDEFNIVDFSFSPAFNHAIEEKVTAEQQALAAKNKLEQVKFEAEQRIAEAKGRAEAIRVESEALKTNDRILEMRFIEKWDGKLPVVTGGSTNFMDINNLIK
ncbi:prohibitin family protein [Patescibacteria group bacterium]|nr:prohibitin family protein [Patescibacteria group bacterium]